MEQYLQLCKHVLENGVKKEDRTGTGTISTFGYQMRFDLSKGFPLLTTKRVPFKLIASELLWFIKGDTNIRYLLEHNNHIWDEWAFKKWVESSEYNGPDMTDFGLRAAKDEEFAKVLDEQMKIFHEKVLTDDEFSKKYGELGPVYGKQWRSWPSDNGETIDQLKNVIVGVPFNIASYALLTYLIAHECGLEVGEFIHSFGDTHIYLNHIEQVKEQLSREPKALPTLKINPEKKSVFDIELDDLSIEGYDPHPTIKAPVAV